MSEWQPIESAPNDTDVIVLMSDNCGRYFQRVAYHSNKRFYGYDSPYIIEYKPLYWAALMEPLEFDQ